MSLRTLIGDVLMKLTDTDPTPAAPLATDPWNYLLAQQLDNPGLNNPAREPAELQRRTLAAFPALSPADVGKIMQELEQLYKQAYDLGSQVNRQQLMEQDANRGLKQAFPQINAANSQKLMLRCLVDTR